MEFCPYCGRIVQPEAAYCQNCGALLISHGGYSSRQPYGTMDFATGARNRNGKNPWIAVCLALIFGFFGLWGVGQMYDGRVRRGIGILLAGLVVGGLFWLSVVLTVILIGYVGMVLFGIFFAGGYLWQAYDAYVLAQEYNELFVAPSRA